MKVQIRSATIADWKIIQQLNDEVFKDNDQYDAYLMPEWAHSESGENYFKKITVSAK